jgi:hypothetical protein
MKTALMWPADILTVHKRAILESFRSLEEEFGRRLLGLLIAGSMARFETDEFSDIDLFVVFDGNWYQHRRFLMHGINVDLFINCRGRLHEAIDRGNEVLVDSYSQGWILYDPMNIVAALQARAGAIRAVLPRRPSREAMFAYTQRLRDSLRSFTRQIKKGDNVAAAFHLHHVIADGIGAFYFLAPRWRPSRKAQLHDLLVANLKISQLVNELLRPTKDIGCKAELAQEFVEAIFELDPQAKSCNETPKFLFQPQRAKAVNFSEPPIQVVLPAEE